MIEYGDDEGLCTKKMCLVNAEGNYGLPGRTEEGKRLLTLFMAYYQSQTTAVAASRIKIGCPDPTDTIAVTPSGEGGCTIDPDNSRFVGAFVELDVWCVYSENFDMPIFQLDFECTPAS